MERVLFITSTRIGDAIINSGVLNHLVETRPDARFTIACGPLAASLFTAVPRVERIIVMAKKPAGAHWIELWQQTVGMQWDLVVDMRCSATAWLLRARERRILRQAGQPLHKVVEAASVLGLEDTPPDPGLWLSDADRAAAVERLPDGPDCLAVCPSASWVYKVWPPEKFAEFILRFTGPDGAMPGARVAMLGGPHDEAYARPIYNALPEFDFVDLLGLGLTETAACLERARFYVGNDSGLMHMSAAMGTPTLGLFGPVRRSPLCALGRALRGGSRPDRIRRDRPRSWRSPQASGKPARGPRGRYGI